MAGKDKSMRPEIDGWVVYMVRCNDGTLYTGITNDLDRRIAAHNSARDGARYTRARQPVQLVYAKAAGSQSVAARLEYQIKKMTRAGKKQLVLEAETTAKE